MYKLFSKKKQFYLDVFTTCCSLNLQSTETKTFSPEIQLNLS